MERLNDICFRVVMLIFLYVLVSPLLSYVMMTNRVWIALSIFLIAAFLYMTPRLTLHYSSLRLGQRFRIFNMIAQIILTMVVIGGIFFYSSPIKSHDDFALEVFGQHHVEKDYRVLEYNTKTSYNSIINLMSGEKAFREQGGGHYFLWDRWMTRSYSVFYGVLVEEGFREGDYGAVFNRYLYESIEKFGGRIDNIHMVFLKVPEGKNIGEIANWQDAQRLGQSRWYRWVKGQRLGDYKDYVLLK